MDQKKPGISGVARVFLLLSAFLLVPAFVHAASSPSALEIVIEPGVAFYADVAGFQGSVGVQAPLGFFISDSVFSDVMMGMNVSYHELAHPSMQATNTSLVLTIGYLFRVRDFFPDATILAPLRAYGYVFVAPGLQTVTTQGEYEYSGALFHTGLRLNVDYALPFFQPLRTGFSIGYAAYLSEISLTCIQLGLFASWSIGGR